MSLHYLIKRNLNRFLSATEDPLHIGLMHFISVQAESLPFGVVGKFREAMPAQMFFPSHDCSSKPQR
ncbi:UNVERIFIED_CONTAM: hypothetical protein NCL1_19540 [Trichonephila clavipes]